MEGRREGITQFREKKHDERNGEQKKRKAIGYRRNTRVKRPATEETTITV